MNTPKISVKNIVLSLAGSSYYVKRAIVIAVDLGILAFGLWCAVFLRIETIWPVMWSSYSWLFAALPFFSFPVFVFLGLYRAIIRFTNLDSLWLVCKAALSSTLVLIALVLICGRDGFPRSVPVFYFLIIVTLLGCSRLAFRILYLRYCRADSSAKRVLIYGAGDSGSQLLIAFQHSYRFIPVAFIDDNKLLHRRKMHGLVVYPAEAISEMLERWKVDLVLLAMPKVDRKRKREILQMLEPFPVEVKSLPSFDKLVDGQVSLENIQDIKIEDLLGRDPVPPDVDLIHSCITDKNVLVTGAGGSIGSELCRQVLKGGPKCLVLFERSEYALYTIEAELRKLFDGKIEIVPVLGSVCRKEKLRAVMKAFHVHTVYHAAAYKHVPLVEFNPTEGIRNNLFGTQTVAEASIEAEVETFVLISTDKAVRPTNIMGASKRMAELVLQALSARKVATRFTMVRFGNVLGSSGSVVPLFRRQLKEGGPITVTHPEMVRYFMTIPEAVELVIQAGAMGKGGDVFVLDMGDPVKIVDLAKKMIHLSGLTIRSSENPDGDIEIEYSGLRPGEKLFEELLIGGNVVGTEHPLIMRAEESYFPWAKLEEKLDRMEQACMNFNLEQVRGILTEAVSGYVPQCDIADPVWVQSLKNGESGNFISKLLKFTGTED